MRGDRGSFARLFCRRGVAAAGLKTEFLLESLSITPKAAVLRGMHFQHSPHGEQEGCSLRSWRYL